MSEYTYSVAKDVAKLVPLYHHEQVPFHTIQRQPKPEPQPSPEDTWRHSTPTSNSPASCDLQDVILYYQSQPELLRLILLSKLEEDKRRAEEAKMRAKELDLMLLQQQQQAQQAQQAQQQQAQQQHQQQQQQQQVQQQQQQTQQIQQQQVQQQQQTQQIQQQQVQQQQQIQQINVSNTPPCQPEPLSVTPTHQIMAPHFSTSFTMHPTPPPSSANSESRATILPNQPIMMRRTSLDVMLASPQPTGLARRDSNLASSLGGSANSDELDDRTFSPISSSTSASTPMLSMTSYAPTMLPFKQHPLSPPSYMDDHSFPNNLQQMQIDTSTPPLDQQVFNQPQPPQQSRYDPYVPQRPRRRREMQAITKIVETRDHPYIDGYFWKNNGNTVQKKTGNRSVYYKCSNSSKGCPVNKTVTWKDNGEYLIKYRGDHLLDCGKVQRIVDM